MSLTGTYYFRCQKCGECCTNMLGKKFGPAITPEERENLAQLASYHHVPFNIRPLTLDWRGKISLYQFGEDKCSFLNQVGGCMIYYRRPMFCRMFPLHPSGLSQCRELKLISQFKPKRVVYPDEMKNACVAYLKLVIPKCQSCSFRYDLNKGWEVNKPFDAGRLTDGDLKYADTY